MDDLKEGVLSPTIKVPHLKRRKMAERLSGLEARLGNHPGLVSKDYCDVATGLKGKVS